jgi:hypothetical protein
MGFGERDVIGMVLAGSFADGKPDLYSDLDIRVVLVNGSFERVFEQREEMARDRGPLVAAFTGEHVGEPQLLITLYQDSCTWTISSPRLPKRPRRTRADARSSCGSAMTNSPTPSPGLTASPVKDLTYLEARMWTWTWYIQSKVLRGELWEGVSALNFVRDTVLFRLLAMSQESRYRGARFAEELQGEHAAEIELTVGVLSGESLLDALRTTVRLYQGLADPLLARLWSPTRGVLGRRCCRP